MILFSEYKKKIDKVQYLKIALINTTKDDFIKDKIILCFLEQFDLFLNIKDFTIIQKQENDFRIESSFDHQIDDIERVFRILDEHYPMSGVFHDTLSDHEEL